MPEVAAADARRRCWPSWPVGERAAVRRRRRHRHGRDRQGGRRRRGRGGRRRAEDPGRRGAEVEVGAPIAVLADPGETVDDLDAALRRTRASPEGDAGTGPRRADVAPRRAAPSAGRRGSSPAPRPAGSPTELDSSAPTCVDRARRPDLRQPRLERAAGPAGRAEEGIRGAGPAAAVLRRTSRAASPRAPESAESRPARASRGPRHRAAATTSPTPLAACGEPSRAGSPRASRPAPHFYVRATVRVDRLLELRAELNDGADGAGVGQRPGGQGGRPGAHRSSRR